MMSKRHAVIGIKQTIRYEWMEKTANLLLAGLDARTIRQALHDFLAVRKGDGSEGERSAQTRTFAVDNLMKIWVVPEPTLLPLRDTALTRLREHNGGWLSVHWALISAAYPFWFNVALQTGRLLNLQDQVTHRQIINRLKEQYGDRPTISRYAQYVIRSFIAWGVLKDAEHKGCYEKTSPIMVTDQNLVILLVGSALLAMPERKATLGVILNSPALFPFRYPPLTGDSISQGTSPIEVVRYGLDDELLVWKDG